MYIKVHQNYELCYCHGIERFELIQSPHVFEQFYFATDAVIKRRNSWRHWSYDRGPQIWRVCEPFYYTAIGNANCIGNGINNTDVFFPEKALQRPSFIWFWSDTWKRSDKISRSIECYRSTSTDLVVLNGFYLKMLYQSSLIQILEEKWKIPGSVNRKRRCVALLTTYCQGAVSVDIAWADITTIFMSGRKLPVKWIFCSPNLMRRFAERIWVVLLSPPREL